MAVGGYLDFSILPGSLTEGSATYTITPQPLPANMTFNRGSGELTFQPAPGQSRNYQFQVVASDGSQSYVEPVHVHVSDQPTATTEVSGQVVDENGAPLADYPVSIDGSSTTTDADGRFTLTGISADPGPIHAGGSQADADSRQGLVAPVAQLMGHDLYTKVNNVLASPLILPKIDWSPAASFSQSSPLSGFSVTNPSMPGFAIHVPEPTTAKSNATLASTPTASGSLQLAQLSADVSQQHMPAGVSSGMLLYHAVGLDLTQPVRLTLPNTQGFQPGAVLDLSLMNMKTGGHDIVGEMVVSSDGQTMTSTDPVVLANQAQRTQVASPNLMQASLVDGEPTATYLSWDGCLFVQIYKALSTTVTTCDGCQPTGNSVLGGIGGAIGNIGGANRWILLAGSLVRCRRLKDSWPQTPVS